VLRVGFDDQIFVAQPRGGISKYFVELLSRLPEHGIEPILLSTGTRNLHLSESGLVPSLPARRAIAEKVTWATWRTLGLPDTTPRPLPPFDVLHHTFTHPRYLRLPAPSRVVTVFDMTPELFPEYFPLGNPHFAKRRYCLEADAVISISQNTADDVERLYGAAAAERSVVIPFGVGEQFFADAQGEAVESLQLPADYLLFVGVRRGYKRFDNAYEAFRILASDDPSLTLVIAGGGPLSAEEVQTIERDGLTGRVHHVSPSDDQMPELYRRAAVFVFPSIYEGFGLPTLEALASGTPTVLADASCSREVGGGAALYFAPGDVVDLVARIGEALSESNALAVEESGPEQGRRFSWDAVASLTADLYRRVSKEN
jgi:glycosyltransferase involved in cell wall biosynthesis